MGMVVVPSVSTSGGIREREKLKAFQEWVGKAGGGSHDDCNLSFARSLPPSFGYGMVAGPGGVERGAALVKVPHQTFMTQQTALNCPEIRPIIERADLTPWQSMCLHLLYEQAQGVRSFWYPYISLLPTETEMTKIHPLLWQQEQRKEWLAGSPMYLKMESRATECRKDYKAIVAAGSRGFVTEGAVRWAAAILLSRAFSLDLEELQGIYGLSDNGQSIALVPWADMLNHSSKAGKESCLRYDSHSGVAFLHAHRSYAEGEQVFDSYGPQLSPSQLLVDYGFVDEENENHVIELPATVLGPVKGKLNESLLKAIGLPAEQAIVSMTQHGIDKSVLAWIRVSVATTKELHDAGWRGEIKGSIQRLAFSSMARFDQPIGLENEGKVLGRLLLACQRVMNEYPTSIEEDYAALASSDHSFSWPRMQAMRACLSEKIALKKSLEEAREAYKRLRMGVTLSKLYL